MVCDYVALLKIFYDATNACSGVYYPTTCIVLNHLYNIANSFYERRDDDRFVSITLEMTKKNLKIFSTHSSSFLLCYCNGP